MKNYIFILNNLLFDKLFIGLKDQFDFNKRVYLGVFNFVKDKPNITRNHFDTMHVMLKLFLGSVTFPFCNVSYLINSCLLKINFLFISIMYERQMSWMHKSFLDLQSQTKTKCFILHFEREFTINKNKQFVLKK